LDLGNSNFLTVWAVKRPILHNIGQFVVVISRFLWFFKMATAAILFFFEKCKILTSIYCSGLICVTVPNFIKIGQTVAEIWRFDGCENGGRPPSWILEIQLF